MSIAILVCKSLEPASLFSSDLVVPLQEAMTSDIPIHYKNMTGKWDFQVLVFTKNYTPNTPKTYYAAWEVLNAQTETDFVYPVDVGVGATYQDGDQEVASGPFTANLGSTWRIIKESPKDTAELLEGLLRMIKLYVQ